jgi:peptide/nickel transport system substrate-binding protein
MHLFCTFIVLITCSLLGAIPAQDTCIVATNLDELITLDPAEVFEQEGVEYLQNTYDRLITLDVKEAGFTPCIAKSWDVSDDGKTYTFTIRDDVIFPSGKPLTASDCAFSLQRIVLLNKSPAVLFTQFGFLRENVKDKIFAKDAHTLVLKTDEVFSASLVLNCLATANAAIVDAHLVLSHEKDKDLGNSWLKTHYAGSGPFQLESWTPQVGLFLTRNDTYFQGAALLKKVILRHVPEIASQKMLLMRGDVDIAYNLSLEQAEDMKDVHVGIYPVAATYYISMNMKNPYLQIPEVRQAIKYLIDYDGLEVLMKKRMSSHQSFIPKGFFGACVAPYFSLDVEKAKSLLQKAGLEKGFTLTLDTTNLELAQALQSMLKKAKITLDILHASEARQVLTKMRQRKHDLGLSQWLPDYIDPHANASTFMYNPDNSESAQDKTVAWRNCWDTSSFHAITLDAMREKDTKKRKEQYEMLQKRFFSEAPFAVVAQKNHIIVQKNESQNKNVRFIHPQEYLLYYSRKPCER